MRLTLLYHDPPVSPDRRGRCVRRRGLDKVLLPTFVFHGCLCDFVCASSGSLKARGDERVLLPAPLDRIRRSSRDVRSDCALDAEFDGLGGRVGRVDDKVGQEEDEDDKRDERSAPVEDVGRAQEGVAHKGQQGRLLRRGSPAWVERTTVRRKVRRELHHGRRAREDGRPQPGSGPSASDWGR